MKKMSKQDVETVIFENAKTGEALEFQHEQHKAEYGAKHFWKADKKFFELLSTFSAAESKVVAYILQKTQPTKNEFIGAYKTIARKLECDVTTVRNTFKKMMENDMLAKTDDERIWMLNPRLLVKGDIIVKARLMSKYDSLLGRPYPIAPKVLEYRATGNAMLGSNLADNLVAMGFIIDTGILQQRRNQVELAIAPLALAVGDVLVQNENRVCFGRDGL